MKELEDILDSDLIGLILERLEKSEVGVDLVLPQFKMDSSIVLDESLKQLGALDAFSPDRADFSGIFTDSSYALGSILPNPIP